MSQLLILLWLVMSLLWLMLVAMLSLTPRQLEELILSLLMQVVML